MSLPVPQQTQLIAQNSTTGAVDFLTFNGATLVASNLVDYGLGPSWRVVTNGLFGGAANNDLLAQNTATGQTDILYLDQNNHLVTSAMSSVGMPQIVGESGSIQLPPTTLVSQLPDGSLDLLELDRAGQLVRSDAVPGTAGLPTAVGVGQGFFEGPMFNGTTGNFSVVTQLANGSIDIIGISGNFPNGSAIYNSSYLIPSSLGLPPIGDVNPYSNNNSNFGENGGTEGSAFISMLPSGQLDAMYFNSGYHDVPNEGAFYASTLLNVAMPGWHLVDSSF